MAPLLAVGMALLGACSSVASILAWVPVLSPSRRASPYVRGASPCSSASSRDLEQCRQPVHLPIDAGSVFASARVCMRAHM